jgi:hypothetical protein
MLAILQPFGLCLSKPLFLPLWLACLRLLAGGYPAASNFLLLRQKKVTKEKATLLSATPLRWRCEGQPAVLGPAGGELELAFGSDNRSP